MMMMMMGEGAHLNPTVHAPPWSLFDDPTDLRRYAFPVSGVSGGPNECSGYELEAEDLDLADAPVDAYTFDEFRMYDFKVRRCARGRSHDWTECPYAHPGEKARRRDPRKFRYSGAACPEFRKGSCRRGDACELAHGVFECWLHPERYRTQPCKDGTACRRRVCFFAHTPDQLRVLSPSPKHQASEPPESYDGSPLRRLSLDAYFPSPVSPTSDSPPASPCGDALRRASWPVGGSCMSELLASVRNLQFSKELSKARSMPRSWGSPIAGMALPMSVGLGSSPVTPKRLSVAGGGLGWLESLDGGFLEEAAVERVESGRALRAKMVERLSKENELDASGSAPDVDWVSELVM